MTDAEMIAELERLTAERTQGEWAVDGFHTSAVIVRAGDKWQNVADADTDSRPNQNWYADAQFIAASGRFLPRLLALAKEAQAARAEAERLGALLDRAHADNEQLRAALQEQRDGLPGEIVAGVIQIAQRAQDYNGELAPIRVRTTEPGNVEIETDELTIAMHRIDATRLASLLLRESAMTAAAEEGQP